MGRAAEYKTALKNSTILHYSRWCLLFLLGLLLGVLLFLPREPVWVWLLDMADHRLDNMQIANRDVASASWTQASIRELRIKTAEQELLLPKLQIHLGLNPLLRAVVHTGPEMTLELQRGRQVVAQGGIDLSEISEAEWLQGILNADLHITWQSWRQPPQAGNLQLNTRNGLQFAPDLELGALELKAILAGERLEIESLQLKQPVPLDFSGFVDLDWTDIEQSFFEVQGEYMLGELRNSFQERGLLRELRHFF